jgi:hypothetical protein
MIFAVLLMAAAAMIVVQENDVQRHEAPPHGAIGMSRAYRISDAVPAPRAMEFRKRTQRLKPGAAAYLRKGAKVGIKQIGAEPLSIIVSYPNPS